MRARLVLTTLLLWFIILSQYSAGSQAILKLSSNKEVWLFLHSLLSFFKQDLWLRAHPKSCCRVQNVFGRTRNLAAGCKTRSGVPETLLQGAKRVRARPKPCCRDAKRVRARPNTFCTNVTEKQTTQDTLTKCNLLPCENYTALFKMV